MATVKAAKRKLRRQLKKYGVKLKDVASRTELHYQTVKKALDPEDRYWNASIAQAAEELIDESKNPLVNDTGRTGTEEGVE